MKERILVGAEELFLRYGFRSVTMDDIARHLGISKKTIYQFYQDKDDIVNQVAAAHMSQERCDAEELAKESANPVDEMFRISQMIREMSEKMNPLAVYELKKYYPHAWQHFHTFKREFLISAIERNLGQGVEQGLYRSDLNIRILAQLRLAGIELGFNPEVFPPDQFRLADVQGQILDLFIRGILTAEGLRLFQQYQQQTPIL